jgi:drug/metabolite transporter (DMT)-like permease
VVVAIVSALIASLLYGLASVLQHRAAIDQPHERSMRLGLLAKLATKPMWLAGVAADGLAFACQFVALGHGSLILVQPLLVSGMLFALPLGAWLSGTRLTRQDWLGALAVVVGLSLFLVVASPSRGRAEIGNWSWLLLGFICIATTGLLVVAASGGPSRRRAALLAGAAGVLYGLTAAFTKAAAHLLGRGITHVLTSWELVALIGAGILGMLLAQSAFQAGPLDSSLPMLTVTDPVVSIIIGAGAFSEAIATGPIASSLEAVGMALMVLGVFVLGQSEAVLGSRQEPATGGSSETGP